MACLDICVGGPAIMTLVGIPDPYRKGCSSLIFTGIPFAALLSKGARALCYEFSLVVDG